MKKIKKLSLHFIRSFQISWNASKPLFMARILIEFVSVFTPIILLFITKKIINVLSLGIESKGKTQLFIQLIIIMGIIQVINMIIARVNGMISSYHGDLVAHYIQLEIFGKINSLDISYFDNPKFYNEIQNANKDSRALSMLTELILAFIKYSVQFVTNLLIMCELHMWIPALIIILNIPTIFVDKYLAHKKYEWQRSRASNDREVNYIKQILESRNYCKDIRCFGLQDYFLNKYIVLWKKMFREKVNIEQKRVFLSFCTGVLPYAGSIFVMFYIGNNILHGKLTVGDFSYYSGISSQLISAIMALIATFTKGYESEIRLTQYTKFLQWKPLFIPKGSEKLTDVMEVEFDNVCFKYPGTEKQVLDHVSFRINKNENMAIVGLNGAGKSTIVKLLLRLYEPEKGRILINGKDIKEYDINSYYKTVGIVFQDFNRYNLKLRETVALADIENVNNSDKIEKACIEAELEEVKWNKGLDTYLGRIFDKDGIELSGGQWQKVALAQAYFKESSMMILDEPNSALDPDAEYRLFNKLKNLCKDKCVLFITHRLSSTVNANKIIVIDNGKCVESGNHDQLMRQSGIYYSLFTKQSKQYLKEGIGD